MMLFSQVMQCNRNYFLFLLPLVTVFYFSHDLAANTANFDLDTSGFKDPFYLLFFLIGIALVPFIAVIATSFTKIVVVLSIARQALGTAQTPPNMVIMSLAIILTFFSMWPVFQEVINEEAISHLGKELNMSSISAFAKKASTPIKNYLDKNTNDEDKALFFNIMTKNQEKNVVSPNDFIILAPAFLVSELSKAFQIGFLIYLPFLVIDMTVANLLMALGMQMLSPTTISLPFKLLLFVLADGWRLIAEGLVKN